MVLLGVLHRRMLLLRQILFKLIVSSLQLFDLVDELLHDGLLHLELLLSVCDLGVVHHIVAVHHAIGVNCFHNLNVLGHTVLLLSQVVDFLE